MQINRNSNLSQPNFGHLRFTQLGEKARKAAVQELKNTDFLQSLANVAKNQDSLTKIDIVVNGIGDYTIKDKTGKILCGNGLHAKMRNIPREKFYDNATVYCDTRFEYYQEEKEAEIEKTLKKFTDLGYEIYKKDASYYYLRKPKDEKIVNAEYSIYDDRSNSPSYWLSFKFTNTI